jgi:uncharacterized protein YdaU (DUF1376 family)
VFFKWIEMMHYYQHNIGDYARDTGHLTILEHGVYRLLLDWCYLNEKPITTEQAIRVSRGNPTETQSVLSEFFLLVSDGWMHKRIAIELEAYHAKAEKNRKNGAKGGRPKPKNNPVGSQTDAKHNPNQEPITKNQEPILREDSSTPSREAGICVVMKSMGIGSVNPQHPKLATLLADGATVADFESAARIAVEGGKGFAYALGVVEGIRADAKRPPKPIIETFRERDSRLEAERMAEFAPGVARKTGLNSVQNFSKTIDAEVKNVTAIASR